MTIRSSLIAAAFAIAFAGAAHADGLRPIEAQSIDLGEMHGVAYYTVEPDGYRIVATVAQGETGTPVRFETVLGAGQSVALSVPQHAGGAAGRVEISRLEDRVLIGEAATN